MTEQQIELLAELQRLAMACSTQTGVRVYHSIEAWPEGGVWSEVRIIRDGGKPPHLDTVVEITAAGIERRVITTHTIETLSQQRDALADWIAANRKEKAA